MQLFCKLNKIIIITIIIIILGNFYRLPICVCICVCVFILDAFIGFNALFSSSFPLDFLYFPIRDSCRDDFDADYKHIVALSVT